MSTVPTETVRQVVRKTILPGENYRTEIVKLINTQFMDMVMAFFEEVANAKDQKELIDMDWYKKSMMKSSLPKKDIALNAGINLKTISNVYGSAKKEVVLDAANENYEFMKELIEKLVESNDEMGLILTIKLKDKTIELDIDESLIVINALAVKRAALRGGLWSAIGKRVEKPLMLTLCYLFNVHEKNYDVQQKDTDTTDDVIREVDFFLLQGKHRHKCEVKLMGKGNPESADAVVARGSRVFVADTLSKKNTEQMDNLKVEWVSLIEDGGWKRFATVLKNLKIPYKEYNGNLEKEIDRFVDKAMST